ncbi:hypothetical protein TNCV_781871 [Trichonephila clavipes]|nr:hypothetical protein TNCV_781871 [Trichonephila clavipes]
MRLGVGGWGRKELSLPRRQNKEKFQQLTEFERGRIIGLRERGVSYRAINARVQRNSSTENDASSEAVDRRAPTTRKTGSGRRKKNSLVNVALYHIHHIWHYRVRLRESGQPIGRLRKTCKNAFPRTIPVSFGRLDTPIATESSLNVHFF